MSKEKQNKQTKKKPRIKITYLKKAHFIKENELKLNQDELFPFFHFRSVHSR